MWQAHHLDRLPLLRHLQEDDDGGYVISSKLLLNYLFFPSTGMCLSAWLGAVLESYWRDKRETMKLTGRET